MKIKTLLDYAEFIEQTYEDYGGAICKSEIKRLYLMCNIDQFYKVLEERAVEAGRDKT